MLLLLSVAGTVLAQPAPTERQEKVDRASQLHAQASAMRDDAERRHQKADAACREKFFVSSCLDDAHQAQLEQNRKARELDRQARELEREVKRQDVAEREAERIREAPAKAAEAAARAAKNREAVDKAQAEVARKQAEAATREGKEP